VSRPRAGFTLIELLIAMSLVGLVMGSALAITLAGQGALRTTSMLVDSNSKARRALERTVEELQRAGPDMVPDLTGVDGSDTVNFVQIIDIVAGVPIWSPTMRIERLPAAEDPADGIDNDGDGVIDEGDLVLTRNVGLLNQYSTVLCTNVRRLAEGEIANGVDDNGNGLADESGFNVQRATDLLTIRICIEEPGEGNATAITSVSASFNLRN